MEKIGAKESRKNKKKKMTASDVVLIVIFVVAITVAAVSGYKLYSIMMEYKAGVDEYNEIADTVVKERDADAEDVKKLKDAKGHETKHWTSPLEINFDELKSINQDVAGWLYMEALPNINYPIVQGSDNDFYLHHTYKKESIFAGSIFVDCKNTKDFSDQNTIVYGHNMKNGSMFGTLKQYKLQETIDKSPYFWVITPKEAYKYKINKENPYYKTVDGILYSKDGKSLILCPRGKDGTVDIPDGTEYICEKAFSKSHISAVKFPDSLKEIGPFAFDCCENLANIDFGHGIRHIGSESSSNIFRSCASIEKADIPSQVESIGNRLFLNCRNLKEIIFHNGLISIGELAFVDTKVERLSIPATVERIGVSAMSEVKDIFAMYVANVDGDTYTLIKGPGKETIEYGESMKAKSLINTGDYQFKQTDKIVTLSTCTGDSSTRFVVQGVRVEPE